jgi:flagellar basal-body rod modification protein FlgD
MTTTTAINGSAANSIASTSSSSSSSSSNSSTSSTSDAAGSQNYFLTLLVAQMNNQDPLNPMDSSEVTSQLAQINTVQGIDQLSTQLTSLLASVSATQTTSDTALIGQQVMVPSNSLTLANGSATGAISLPQSTSVTNVLVKNSAGATIKTIQLGAESAGTVPFSWDGSTDGGAAAAAGNYTFSVQASSGTASVTGSTLSLGTVTAVVPGASGASPTLTVGSLGNFSMSQVTQIN